jgi:hypothetical protein
MHITRRNCVYYFRKKIPVDLVAVYGEREIIYSLREGSPHGGPSRGSCCRPAR